MTYHCFTRNTQLIRTSTNANSTTGLGLGSADELTTLLLPRRAQTQQLLQAHGTRRDANPAGSARAHVLVRCRR